MTSYYIISNAIAMVFLLDLPNELVFEIVKHLDQHRDIRSIAFVSWRYYSFFIDDVYRFNISSQGGCGILWAIAHDQVSAVGKFLDLGLDMNIVPGCNHNQTLLHLAAHHCSLSTVSLLLQRGADITAKDERGVTPLFKAISHRHDEIVRIISERITDIGKVFVHFSRALTPLHAACEYKLPNAARFFLKLGDDVHARDIDGKSPLHYALRDNAFAFNPKNSDSNAVFDTVMVLLEFGVKLDLVILEHSCETTVSTFNLGINHEDPRVRELFREKRDKTSVIVHGGLYVGRAWMSSEAGEYDGPNNQVSQDRHSSKDLDAGVDFRSIRPSETFISPCSGYDELHLEPSSYRGAEYTELAGDSFPALSNISVAPDPSTHSTASVWSQSNIQEMMARISLAEAKAKTQLNQKVSHTDPFPQLAETPLTYSSMEAKEIWAGFRKPQKDDRLEGSHVKCLNSEDQLNEGRRHKARGRKSWKPLKL